MRKLILIAIIIASVAGLLHSCKKYTDPSPTIDPRLTNPYCNDPEAVNYNWGFPGKPDNTTCFFPSDLFAGTYRVYDSIYVTQSGLFIRADSFDMNVYRYSAGDKKKINVTGFCGGGVTLRLTAGVTYTATVDTIGDTAFVLKGQQFCTIEDTVSGTITRDRLDSSLIRISFQVYGKDTNIYTHQGQGRRK